MIDLEPRLLWSPWLNISNDLWENLLPLAKQCFYAKGSVIIEAGKSIQHLYYLRKGEIKTMATSPEGLEKTMWYVQEGCVFGETPFFNEKPCLYVFSAMRNCEVYLFDRQVVLQNIIPNHPAVVVLMLRTLARKVHVLSTQVEDLAFRQPLARISRLLYLLAHQHGRQIGEEVEIAVRITQQELANMIGTHRVTVSNALRRLEDETILQRRQNKIVIKDIARLESYASLEL